MGVGAAQEFTEAVVGGFFVTRENDITLTTTAAEILRNDPERVGYLIINTGLNGARLAFNANPTDAASIHVAISGGTFRTNIRDDFTLPTNALHGIAAAATTTLHIVEVVRVSQARE